MGIFVMFTAKKLLWILKEKGESWDGAYFGEKISTENVIPFLGDPENVLVVGDTVFVHDKAVCMRAAAEGKQHGFLGKRHLARKLTGPESSRERWCDYEGRS